MQDLLRKNDLSKKEQILLLENAMLQYSYNEQPIEDFKLYDESEHEGVSKLAYPLFLCSKPRLSQARAL
ncbi:MAG: hypothetical protein K2I55_09045, partial [Phocaeicola sp.]|nr:hypothetical protein [Phocaeicola sp.]